MAVFLIASAAYVEPELEASFGRLPPAFLPLGNRRLFTHQLSAAPPSATRRLLSIPEQFEPDAADVEWLAEAGVELVPVPTGLTLGQSLVFVINVTGIIREHLCVLYGDTLIDDPGWENADLAAVAHTTPDIYQWGVVADVDGRLEPASLAGSQGQPAILTGRFHFADSQLLVQAVTRRGGDFLAGLDDYAMARPVRAVVAPRWLDFGHAATYHRSRRHISTARAFNRIEADGRVIWKSGSHTEKIEAEAEWFEMLPPRLRIHAPAYLGRRTNPSPSYGLEYLNLPTLADLHVFGRLPRRSWERIFAACDEFLSACAAELPPPDIAESLAAEGQRIYLDKTIARLEQYAAQSGLSLTQPCRYDRVWLPSLEQIGESPPVPSRRHHPRSLRLSMGISASATSSTICAAKS